jgi:hypothetical protein
MRTLKAPPNEATLFDLEATAWWSRQLSANALRALRAGWQGIFQQIIVQLLERPAEALGVHFDEALGRPSKELYALSGLLLIAEFKNWTIAEAAEAWSLDAGVQFALHLPRDRQYLCPRTLDNYRKLLRENGDVQEIFTTVTRALIEALEIEIRRQRLDSTHVLSHMAKLTRGQLLTVAVRRFLVQLRKHDAPAYEALEKDLRARYEPAETRLFGWGARQGAAREEGLQQAAEDLALLVSRFAAEPKIAQWKSYQGLGRLFAEHCEVQAAQTVVRPQSRDAQGGSAHCLQNPSDPDAGYSGHKGAGHQVQIAQALPPRDAAGQPEGPGLVTACLPQSAAVRDNQALAEVLAQQAVAGLLPKELVADTIYGSDLNVRACALAGVELCSPVGGVVPKNDGPAKHNCTVAERELKARLRARRLEQQTDSWQAKYRRRSGIEGLHRALDAVTGIKKLRVRGSQAVRMAVLLKATGWNILAAAKIQAHRARRKRAVEAAARSAQKIAGKQGPARRFRTPRILRRRRIRPLPAFFIVTMPAPPRLQICAV